MADMALSATFVPDIPKDIIFPEELNAYLRDQIQYLTHENGMLKRNLSECQVKFKESQTELQSLSKQMKQFENAAPGNSFTSISNVASAKIVELSKKLREKASELEATRTKCSRLEHQIRSLEEKQDSPKSESVISAETQNASSEAAAEETKQLQDKLSSSNAKLFDARNVNTQLKNDLKLANKILQQEVGDSFENLQSLINSGTNWRGRAQMICDLQQKNMELREKLKSYVDKGKQQEPPSHPKPDRRVETLSKENLALKSEIQEIRKKFEAAKARLKVFENENSVVKAKMAVINEQQENDRQLISTLTAQLATIRNVQNDEAKKKDLTITKLQKDCKDLKLEISKERCRSENLSKEIDDKVAEIRNLRNGTVTRSSRPPSAMSSKPVIDEKVLSRLEAERLRLLELTKIANGRLDAERKIAASFQMQLKSERQKNAKLESRIARIELEKSDKSSAYSLTGGKTKDKELMFKDRLELAEENVKALQTRLETEQKEREMDFQEFSKILQNYTPNGD